MTDRQAIFLALNLAVEWEAELRDGSRGDVAQYNQCVANIAAFKRVLDRYYGGGRKDPTSGATLRDVLTGKEKET